MPLKQNLVYNFLLSVSQVLFPLVTIPYISRILSPESVGRVGFIDSYTYFFTVLAEFGIITYGVREISKCKANGESIDTLVSELLLLQGLSSLIVLIPFVSSLLYLQSSFTEPSLFLWALGFYVTNSIYTEWFFWGTEQFRFVAIRSFMVRLIATILVFVLVKSGEDYIFYYAIMAGAGMLNLGINFIQLARQVKLTFHGVHVRRHLKPLLTIHGITLCYAAFSMLDTPLLRVSSHSEYQTGIYVFSIKIIRTASALITDFLLVLFPFSISVQQSNIDVWKAKLSESATLILLFSIPMTVGLYGIAPALTHLYFGKGFNEVSICLQWLAVLLFIVSLELFINKQILVANHLEKVTLRVAAFCSVLFLLIALYAGRNWGYKGAGFALIFSEACLLGSYLWLKKKYFSSLHIFKAIDIVKIVLASIIMYCVLYFFPDQDDWTWAIFIFYVILAVVVYFALVVFVFKISLRNYFINFITEKFN